VDYIVSRRFAMPTTAAELQAAHYFNLWRKRFWPLRDLAIGDVFYWYESPRQRIVWKARVDDIERFEFESRDDASAKLIAYFGPFDERQPYFVDAPERGFGLAFHTAPLERLDIPKPPGIALPQLGWERVSDELRAIWLGAA
jgi:hypothetical protein